ncbi:MAG: hypothetical protein HC772_07560, partial [Leptolyngbyaceae cyanobacterium CRU_2_3]|nr:hypothetical protein [Leptolyngbyaceae cyanobacterium CRU_2_3]
NSLDIDEIEVNPVLAHAGAMDSGHAKSSAELTVEQPENNTPEIDAPRRRRRRRSSVNTSDTDLD